MYSKINKLLEESIKGDITSKEELLISLRPIVISSIRKYFNRYDQYEDLIQEGYQKILEAIDEYDPSKGVHFLGYVKIYLKYYYLDKNKKKEEAALLNQQVGDQTTELIDLIEDTELSQEEEYIRCETSQELRTSLLTLTKRQRQVVLLYYIENMSLGEISVRLGISYRTVVNTKKSALDKMRSRL